MKPWRRLRCVSAVALAVFACASQAAARQWDYVAKSDDGLVTFYGDRKSAAVHGPLRRMWLLYDYQQVQQDPDTFVETRSIVSLASFDCRNHKLGTVQSTNYAGNMGKGKAVVKSVPLSANDIHYVNAASGSIDEKVLTFACTPRKRHDLDSRPERKADTVSTMPAKILQEESATATHEFAIRLPTSLALHFPPGVRIATESLSTIFAAEFPT